MSSGRHARLALTPSGHLFLKPELSYFNGWSVDREPLQKRGWTLQERLLSRSILHCSRMGYLWVCRCKRDSCGQLQPEANLFLDSPFIERDSIEPDSDARLPILLNVPLTDRMTALTCWYTLLMDYSNRRLSIAGDKLPAIQGIANVFARWIGGKYIHGIWEVDLVHGLIWGPQNLWVWESASISWVQTWGIKPSKARRVFAERAPSWSWASVDGFQQHPGPRSHHPALDVDDETWDLFCEQNIHAKVQVASRAEHVEYSATEYQAADGYHDDQPKLLRVSGTLVEIRMHVEKNAGCMWRILGPDSGEYPDTVAGFDDPSFPIAHREAARRGNPGSVFLLPIVAYWALIVVPTDCSGVYRRVGLWDEARHMASLDCPSASDVSEDSSDVGSDSSAFVGSVGAVPVAEKIGKSSGPSHTTESIMHVTLRLESATSKEDIEARAAHREAVKQILSGQRFKENGVAGTYFLC